MPTFIGSGIILVVLFLIGLAAHSLSTSLYRRLIREGSSNARGYRIASFILSFLLILAIVVVVFIMNIRIQR